MRGAGRRFFERAHNHLLDLLITKGSHRQFKHATKAGRVTIAGHPSDDLAPGTYNSILKQAGLKEQ